MNQLSDLRTTREKRGLTLEDLAFGMVRPATISEIESGLRVPQRKTIQKLESMIGPIDWKSTLAGPDRKHLIFALSEFINPDIPGTLDRIRFLRQILQLFENEITKNEIK